MKLPLIACTLDDDDQGARLAEWKQLLSRSTAREATPTGLRYSFVASDPLETRVRDLVAAERACCGFLHFQIGVEGGELLMSVSAPAEAQDALRFIFPA
jgi:hypothetical protein